jgi:hypothetical protein
MIGKHNTGGFQVPLEKLFPSIRGSLGMTEFRQGDNVRTLFATEDSNGEEVVSVGSVGMVTVVGVGLDDGSTNGVEVLFEGNIYTTYHPSQLRLVSDRERPKFGKGDRVVITEENIRDVAEWCDGRISRYDGTPRLRFQTSYPDGPENFQVTASIGDTLQQHQDGRFQLWVGGEAGFVPEDRPAEMKKDRVDDPISHALAMVQLLHYKDVPIADIYVVWFCQALQNWKALVSTNIKDNCYYEVTHNGDKNETYVDQYIKVTNTQVDLNTNKLSGTKYSDMRSSF